MEYIYPDYYRKFHCTADQCTDTCCAGWQIVIDRKTLKKYRYFPGSFGNRLHNSIDWETHSFQQDKNRRCVFLNEKNLCDICLEAGEDYLSRTCRRYPRHYEEFENLREISLSLSCPEAARLILGSDKPLTLKRSEQKSDSEEYDVFDFLLFTKLQEIRDHLFALIADSRYTLEEKMVLMVTEVHDLQTRISRNELFDIDRLLEKYSEDSFAERHQWKWLRYGLHGEVRCYLMHGMMYRLHELEVLNDDWDRWLRRCERTLYEDITPEEYIKRKNEFDRLYADRTGEYERLLEYFIFTYFCGAVYDEDAYGKIRLAVVHTLLIRELDLACWMMSERFTFEDQVEIAHRYAREIEHSDLNLNAMERMMSEDPFFDLDHLLVAIWGQRS